MDSSDTQSLNTLTDDEIGRLVSVVVDDFGRDLARTRFNDVMLSLFEHVPGFETLSRKRSQQYLTLLWLRYQQATLANPSRP